MRVMLACEFFSGFTPNSLSRIGSQIRIFEGAILHDALSLNITILSVLLAFWRVNGQKIAISLCHNSAPKAQTLLQPQQQRN